MIKLTLNEIRNNIKAYKIWICYVLMFSLGLVWIYRSPATFDSKDYQIEFFRFYIFFMAFISGTLISESISKGTIKHQLMCLKNRIVMWNVKAVEAIIYILCFWLSSCFLGIIESLVNGGNIDFVEVLNPERFLIYFLSGWVLCTMGYLLSLITKNVYISLVGMMILWVLLYQLLPFFIYAGLIDMIGSNPITKVFWYIPQVIVVKAVNDGCISLDKVLALLTVSLLCYIGGYHIYKKMEV